MVATEGPTRPGGPGDGGPAGSLAPPRRGARWLGRLLAGAQLSLAALAVLGIGPFVATLLVGRSALWWPSAQWLFVAGLAGGAAAGAWVLAARTVVGTPRRRLQDTAWPALALLPSSLAGLAVYGDEASHHIAVGYPAARESLLAYTAVAFATAQAGFWLATLARRMSPGGELPGQRPDAGVATGGEAPAGEGTKGGGWGSAAPVALGAALAIYLNAAVFLQWLPRQSDLLVNLRGARDLQQGILPYHDAIPVWADRVHLLPATLVLLFGPLARLPQDAAGLLFFLGNQALWLLAMALLVWRLAPPGQRPFWLAAALVFGGTYWPWQEAIRYGQQDGLLIFLFVLSITSATTAAAGTGQRAAGMALGLALVVKPLSIWLPLCYLIHGRWRALAMAGVTGAALALATLPVTGWEPWGHFLGVELPAMLPGTVRGTNIPLPSLHARMFVGREALGNGEPAPTLAIISALNGAANLLGLLLVGHLALRRSGTAAGRRRDWLLDASLGLTLTLLLAPMAWQHYASWLCIAFFVLALPGVWRPLGRGARVASGALAGSAYFLLSLEDSRLLRLLSPLVERWPAALAFYTAGLLCLAAALVITRFAVPREA